VSPHINDGDITTKKFVTDLLKGKAGTTYAKNEKAKKVKQEYIK